MDGTATNETAADILARLNSEQVIVRIPGTILILITMIVGIVGNSVACYVYGFRLKMTPNYLFVLFLAVVDLISCLTVSPARVVQNFIPLYVEWDPFCKTHMALAIWSSSCNCWLLIVIAADRYRRICSPLKTQLSMKGAKIVCVIIMAYAIINGGAVLHYYGSHRIPTKYENVYGNSCSAARNSMPFWGYYLAFDVAVFLTLSTLYSIVLYNMKKKINSTIVRSPPTREGNTGQGTGKPAVQIELKDNHSSGNSNDEVQISVVSIQQSSTSSGGVSSGMSTSDDQGPSSTQKEPAKKETAQTQNDKRAKEKMERLHRTTVTMMMITIVFVCTFIPTAGLGMVPKSKITKEKIGLGGAMLFWFAKYMYYICSCVNPIIYGFRNKAFMTEVRRKLFKK